MEIHLRAAGARPFVQAGRRVGGNGNCAGRGIFREAERIASCERRAERSNKAGRPVEAGEVAAKECAADLRAGLIANDRGAQECRTG